METKTTFTRHDYMNNKCSHYEYYSQFVTEGMKSVILNKYSKEKLKEKFAEDQHLNNIPLKWWDSFELLFQRNIASTNKRLNGQNTWSSAEHTCAMKAAAKQIIES